MNANRLIEDVFWKGVAVAIHRLDFDSRVPFIRQHGWRG